MDSSLWFANAKIVNYSLRSTSSKGKSCYVRHFAVSSLDKYSRTDGSYAAKTGTTSNSYSNIIRQYKE